MSYFGRANDVVADWTCLDALPIIFAGANNYVDVACLEFQLGRGGRKARLVVFVSLLCTCMKIIGGRFCKR